MKYHIYIKNLFHKLKRFYLLILLIFTIYNVITNNNKLKDITKPEKTYIYDICMILFY